MGTDRDILTRKGGTGLLITWGGEYMTVAIMCSILRVTRVGVFCHLVDRFR
jgi:hypothetical protein